MGADDPASGCDPVNDDGRARTPSGLPQEDLQRSRRRLAAIFENSTDGLLLFDDQGRCHEANGAACELLGVTRDRLTDCDGGLFVASVDFERILAPLSTKGRLDGVANVALCDGRRRTIEHHAIADVLPGLHLLMFSDATETRAAQAAQARLAAIVEFSGEAIIGINERGEVEDWNRAAETLYGYSATEMLGARASLLEPADRAGELDCLLERVRQGEVVTDLESRARRKDGTLIEISLTVSPIRDASGRITGCAQIVRDISERRQADNRFKMLMEAAPDAIIAVDRRGKIGLVNGQAEVVFGYSRDEMIGQTVELLVPAALRGKHQKYVEQYAQAPWHRTVRGAGHLKGTRKDGSEFDAEITLKPLDSDRLGFTIIAAIRDVTEKNRMRDQLILSDRMVSIGTLAAGVAHEINNPLAAVTVNLDLVLADVKASADRLGLSEIVDQLEDAREAANRVRQIVRDLKTFSRSEEETLLPVDARKVMDASLRMAWNEIRHRAGVHKDYDEVPSVLASESRLGQVFLNLLVNAAQAIPEGRAEDNEIRVSIAREASGEVVISIADTGSGMPAEVIKRLFTPFFTTKPIGVGTGLGLSICHRLVTSFGGRISVESDVGRGTTFRIHLPAVSADQAVHASAPNIAQPARRRGHVLVIDDDPIIGHSVRRALSTEHDVTVLISAEKALAILLEGEQFDVIICDLMMPQMTGMDFHRELSSARPEQAERIIFMTGGAFTPSARAFLDEVANVRIDKPFEIAGLRALVNAQIR